MHHTSKKKRGIVGSDDQLESEDSPASPAAAIKDPPSRRTPHKPITQLVVTQVHAKSSPVLEEKPVTPSSSAKYTDHTTWISLPAPRTKLYSQQNRRLEHAALLGASARRVSETACERVRMANPGMSDKEAVDGAGAVDVDAAPNPGVKMEDEPSTVETPPEDEQEKERTTRREAIAFLTDEHRVRVAQNRLARRSAKWRRKLSGSPTLQALAREDELYISTSGLSSAQEASFLRKLRWIKKFHSDAHHFVNEHPICLECEDTCTQTRDASCKECRRRHKACPRQKMYQIRQLCAWMDDITEDAAARALRVLGTARRKNSKALLDDGPRRRGKYQSAQNPRRRRSWEIDLHLEMGWSIGGSDEEEAEGERNLLQHRGSRDGDEESAIPAQRIVRGRARDSASSDDDEEEGPGGGGDGGDEMVVDGDGLDPGRPARFEEDGDELDPGRPARNATKGGKATSDPNYGDDHGVNHSGGGSARGSITQRSSSPGARSRHAFVNSTTDEEDCPTIVRRYTRLARRGDSVSPYNRPPPRTARPSSDKARLASEAGDEVDDLDAARPGNLIYHDMEDTALAGYVDDECVDDDRDDRPSTIASFIKTSSAARSRGRSFSYLTDDDNLSIAARYARPSSCISKHSSCEALLGRAAGVEGQELEEEGPALAGCNTDEDHEDDRHAPASTGSTRPPTPRVRCRGGSISCSSEEEDNDNLSAPRDSRPSSCRSTTAPSSHEAQSQLSVPAPALLTDEPEEAEDEAGANGAREFLGGDFGQAEAEEAEAESDLWSVLDLELAYPEYPETTPGNGHVNVDVAVKVDGVVRRLPGRTSTSTPTPSSTAKWNGTCTGTGVPPAAPSSSSSHSHPRPRPRPAASPSPRLPTIGVSSFSSKLQLARSRTTGIDAGGEADRGHAGPGLELELELRQGEGEGEGKKGHDDRGNAIVYIDDTAMVVEREGLDDEGESEGEGEDEGGVDHARGSGCTSLAFGAVLDDDDDDVEVVVVEGNGEKCANGSAGTGHCEAEPGDEERPPGIGKRDTAPECESNFEVIADDRDLNHTNDLSWGAGAGCADDDNAGTTWGSKLKGDVDIDPNASVIADDFCDEESGEDNSSDGNSSEDDSAHEGKHAQPASTTLVLLPPHQVPTDEDHDHDGGSENEMDVDDDEGNEIEVRVTNAKEDGESDTGSHGAGNLEAVAESDGGGGGASAGPLDHADEFSGREGEPGEGINQNYNIDDEASNLDAANGFVDDSACTGSQADYRNNDERAERPAAGVDESTVDYGESDDAGDEGRNDERDVNFIGPDIRQLDDGDGEREAKDPNQGKIPAKPASTPDRDDEIHRLRQALENEQKNSARLRAELKAQSKNHIAFLARLGLRTSIVRRQERLLRVDQHADTKSLQTALHALQDKIDREVEVCMCGVQREAGFEGGDEYDFGAVELEKNQDGKRRRRLPDEDENQEEDGDDDLGERQGFENFSGEDPPRSRFKRARFE
ncbi:hypothetical protein GALMADRAFT_147407 [Galerina marginata CBS 339.88]|uniref:Uncharacterized protein n=1 Tax=Galerina marginata (strain CBS 339.88) TaxID=685588 RepID=A0A067SKB4_GALM3|nr:hypothetical protein GALMADRAFT_147407 [Galerina marginata CBS 339.88]